MDATALANFLAALKTILEWMVEQVGVVINAITGSPVLFVSVCGALALIVIGIFRRLFQMGIG